MKTLLSGLLVLTILGVCLAAPEPAIVQKPGDWTLDVRYEQPEQIILEGSIQQRYWYVIFSLTNKSGKDVDFYPAAELVTDTIQVVPAVKGTSAILFEKIKTRHQGRFPFLQLLENASNKMLQGEDNSLDVVIIFPDFDPNAKAINIFVSGLSNETVVLNHPTEKDSAGNPVKIYLRKTIELDYKLSGDPAFRSEQLLKFDKKRWVMR